MPLTDTKLRSTKSQSKPFKLYDQKGLFLFVTPSGNKLWRFKYRFEGREKLLSLGSYPELSLADARAKRDCSRKDVAMGKDPSELKKAIKASGLAKYENSFEILTRLWITKNSIRLSPQTTEKNLRLFERDIFPWIGDKPINELRPKQILDTAKRIESRGAVDTAKRAIQLCGQVFQQAIEDGIVESDPTRDIRRSIKPNKDKHFPSLTEPREVKELLRAIDAFNGSFVVMCAIKLAPLVFVRPGELRKARWQEIDLETCEWRFLVTKTNTEHLVPLSKQAINILSEIKPLTGNNEFVFQVGNDPKKPMSDATLNAVLRRMGYDTKTQITGHGFRAMARTMLHERLDFAPEIIEHQLSHTVPDNLGGAYNRTKFISKRKLMMQQWADYLDSLRNDVPFQS